MYIPASLCRWFEVVKILHSLCICVLCRHLQYIGTAEMGDKSRHTLVRSCLDIGVSDSIVQYLNEMGFK